MKRLAKITAVAGLVAALSLAPLPATAADAAGETSWSVVPANEAGPDGRRVVDAEIDPGATVNDHFAIKNSGAAAVTFAITAADGFYTRNGRFDILSADKESTDSGTWITVAGSVTVDPGATVVVPFTITVPELAEPGDHAAGITASIVQSASSAAGSSVGVESRVGFKVLTRVTGEITPSARIDVTSTTYETSWNPLRPGSVTVTFDVTNTGNTRLQAAGVAAAGGGSRHFPADGTQELLPGDTRTLTSTISGVWPLFFISATTTLTADVITLDGSTKLLAPVTASMGVWAMPWPQLVTLAGLALVIGSLFWGRLRSRRKLHDLLEKAREEGRQQAAA